MSCGIYIIYNLESDRLYIGSSVSVEKRIKVHFSCLRSRRHGNSYLQEAFNESGESSFFSAIIENLDLNLLLEREQYYIEQYKACDRNSGYNIAIDAMRSTHAEETKQKIRAALLGRKQSYQHRERGRVARIGLKLSESRKAQLKISMLGPGNPMYGRHQSLKTRSLMSQNRTDKRRVIKRDMDGNITGEFPSVLQSAASVKNGSTSNISRCCKGKYDSCYKYRWEYA